MHSWNGYVLSEHQSPVALLGSVRLAATLYPAKASSAIFQETYLHRWVGGDRYIPRKELRNPMAAQRQ